MSLAKRLSQVIPQPSNRTCGTCKWVNDLAPADQTAWRDWINADRSLTQLWEIACADETQPYRLSLAALRMCVRTHHRKDDT